MIQNKIFASLFRSIQKKRWKIFTTARKNNAQIANLNLNIWQNIPWYNFSSTSIQELIYLRELTRKQKSSYTIVRLDLEQQVTRSLIIGFGA